MRRGQVVRSVARGGTTTRRLNCRVGSSRNQATDSASATWSVRLTARTSTIPHDPLPVTPCTVGRSDVARDVGQCRLRLLSPPWHAGNQPLRHQEQGRHPRSAHFRHLVPSTETASNGLRPLFETDKHRVPRAVGQPGQQRSELVSGSFARFSGTAVCGGGSREQERSVDSVTIAGGSTRTARHRRDATVAEENGNHNLRELCASS